MSKKQINDTIGTQSINEYLTGNQDKENTKLAVRYTLQEISKLYPGKSLEIRVPPAGATQILKGSTHRRGTPPAVVECDMQTWLNLYVGKITWQESLAQHKLKAYGEKADLSQILPIHKENKPT